MIMSIWHLITWQISQWYTWKFIKNWKSVKDSVLLGENLKKQLKTDFQTELSPELKIQEDLVKYKQGKIQLPELIESVSSSTPLKTEEIKKSL